MPLGVGDPFLHVVYNDGQDAHHPSIAMPCFFQAQVVHNGVGVAVGQREVIGREVPALQPWEPPSEPKEEQECTDSYCPKREKHG